MVGIAAYKADSRGQVWPSNWRPPGADLLSPRVPSELSHMVLCRRW